MVEYVSAGKSNVLSFLSLARYTMKTGVCNIQQPGIYKYVKEMLSWIILNTLWHNRVQRNTSNFVVKMYGSDNKFNESVTPLSLFAYLATLECEKHTKR